MVHISRLGRFYNFFISGLQIAKAKIFLDGSFVKPGILQHHAELFTVVLTGQMAYVMPINFNRAFGHIIETHEQVNQRGFTGTSRTNNSHHFSRFDFQIEIPNERFICHILEVHILEANLTCQILLQLFCLIIDFVYFVQNLENPVQRRLGTLQLTC